jgi:pSer/pThr/pTyr-binding forkhead associated (FHA) protein
MFKLVIADDEGKTTVVPLVRDEISIGRKEGNTIRLTERNVSRKHAKLRKANGSYLVEDLQSYNGVKVNGRRIGGEVSLKAGDQITIGDYQLALQMEDAASAGEATQPATVNPGMGQPAPAMANGGGGDAVTAMIAAPGAVPAAPAAAPVPGAAPGTAPPARLVMISPPSAGAEFALSRPITKIGRAEELEIWVNHRSISREHAEVTYENGQIRVRDLGSANGVRVNNRDVQMADVKSGDTIELGQVRFRVVGPGEAFHFDAAATMQMDAIVGERRPNRVPLFVAAGVVSLGAVVALVVALSGGDPETTVQPIGPAPVAVPTPTVPTDVSEAQITALVTACRAALNAGQFPVALQRAGEALALRPDDQGALGCQQDVQQAQIESEAYGRGYAALAAGNLETCYIEFEGLPPESAYRHRPEVQQCMTQFAASQLSEGETLLGGSDATGAAQRARTVLNMATLDETLRRTAQDLLRRATSRGAVAAAPRVERTPDRPDRTPDRGSRGGHPERGGTSPTTGGGREGSQAVTAVAPPTTGGGGSDQTPMQAARACLTRPSPNPCVVDALRGRARQPEEFAMLIATYQAMGNQREALDNMERFVQRFPSDRRAAQYRQILLQHGR